jgi:2-keto-4-pentenoate hydratase
VDRVMAAANYLLGMRQEKRQEARLPADIAPRSLEEAYQIQAQLVEQILARIGGQPVGYKVAATNVRAQQLLAVDAPLYGRLLSASCHPSPAALSASDFTVRCVEAEFGFEVGEDMPPNGGAYTTETVKEYLSAALPALEIVDHRYHDWSKVGGTGLVADKAIHGAWVEGERVNDWRTFDFAHHPLTMFVSGAEFAGGSGAAVLGNPLAVVAWLANELPHYGRQLLRGDRITTGTAAEVYFANSGDHIRADFGSLGQVEVTLA